MTPCPFSDALDELAAGELDAAAAARARDHAAGCASCGRELALLRAERTLFAARARSLRDDPAAGDFAALEHRAFVARQAARAEARGRRARRSWGLAALCAAAALALAVRAPRQALAEGGQCALPTPRHAGAAWCARGVGDDIAALESRYAACLTATPQEPLDVCL